MTRSVVAIADLTRRVPEAGRIRIGQKTDRGAPKAIGEFRFTSHDRKAIDQIATLYGGTVKDWADPKAAAGQFEVVTDATEIRVVLPPDPLGGTPLYELWSGGGCERRCDGVTATIQQTGPEGPEPTDVPCLCAAKGELACNVTTHLSVILPEIRFAGVWRLTTKSWNAATELPGMVDMIHEAQGAGLQYATLALKHRRSTTGGRTRKFLVPVLGVDATVEQMVSGDTRLLALPATDAPALAAGCDDDEIEAELLDETISAGDAARIRALVLSGGDETKAAFLARFGCRPADLPLALLPDADDWLSDLEAASPAPEHGGTTNE